ncbi:uncharacterized protein LOC112567852 [Pomacea canaliculata]|uniref:uncharacterized protein LOC112567852 n=1 Tax=Pomacea canaliculata TaxID=400727 RepID=UPI000D728950|nr:uncharacterized protein LOC112567852 [Pomacea canaliculata]
MQLVFSFVFVSFILVKVICEEENSCAVLKVESCIHAIHVNITSDLNTFSLSYRKTSGNEEITALCDWIGHFLLCETKTGIHYNVESPTQVSFTLMSDVKCLDGNFTLNANGAGNFPCIKEEKKSKSKSTVKAKKLLEIKVDTVKGHHKPAQKKEYGCAVLKIESCIHTIEVRITSELEPFNLFHRTTSEIIEITAICDWAGHFFVCKTMTGIHCNVVSRTQVSFQPMSGEACLDGNFTLNPNDHGNFACIEQSGKSRSESTDKAEKHRENKGDTVKGDQNPPHNDSPGKNVNFLDFAMIIPVIEIAVGILVVIIWSIRRAALL